MINTIVLSLQAADFGERLCGAFNFLPPPELQTHLLGIWKNLTQDPNKECISPPLWVKDYRIVSDILVHPSMSSVDELMQTGYIGDELSGRSYCSGIDPCLATTIGTLIPSISEESLRTLLHTIRQGFVLRLLLDNRDTPSGHCHNMIWMMHHFVGCDLIMASLLLRTKNTVSKYLEPSTQRVTLQLRNCYIKN